MALANLSDKSHINPQSNASLFRTSKDIRKDRQEQTDRHVPRMLQRYKAGQTNSEFIVLPEELEQLILSACAENITSNALLNLGLTCKYWHLRARNFIETDPHGQAFKQTYAPGQFVAHNGKAPVEVAKDIVKHYWSFETAPAIAISQLKSSSESAVIEPRASIDWWTRFTEAIAGRKNCVTGLDMWGRTDANNFLVQTIKATPRGSYLALLFLSESISGEQADDLAKAMKNHPVVCLVDISADLSRSSGRIGESDLNFLVACAENQVQGTLFRFEFNKFKKKEARQLANTLRKLKAPVSLEISANKTSKESMKVIIKAVRSINKAAPAKVMLTCSGTTLIRAVNNKKFDALAKDGIHFGYTSSLELSSDVDSDTIVGSTSSE